MDLKVVKTEVKDDYAGPFEETGRLITGRKHPITSQEALKILKTTSHDKCCCFLPEKPRGGTVYLFKPTGPENVDGWKNDGYKWKNQGTTRLPRNRTPLLQKKYFYAINKDGSTDHSRRKDVFCMEGGTDPHYLALVHYVGEIDKILEKEAEPDVESSEDLEDTDAFQDPGGGGEDVPDTDHSKDSHCGKALPEVTTSQPGPNSVSSTPDLAAAMETMKAALAAQQEDTPVIEMFNTLFESVRSNLKNPDVEYRLVVSDKRSGKSALIGTEEGKQLASNTPEVVQKTKGNRRLVESDSVQNTTMVEITKKAGVDIDGTEVEEPVPTTKRRKQCHSSTAEKTLKRQTVAVKTESKVKPKQSEIDIHSRIKTDLEIKQKTPRGVTKREDDSEGRKKAETRSPIVKLCKDLDKSGRKKGVLKDSEMPKTAAETAYGRSRRNINTPNWRDVLSGKASIKDDKFGIKSGTDKKSDTSSSSPEKIQKRKLDNRSKGKESRDAKCKNAHINDAEPSYANSRLNEMPLTKKMKVGHSTLPISIKISDERSNQIKNKVPKMKHCSVKLKAVDENMATGVVDSDTVIKKNQSAESSKILTKTDKNLRETSETDQNIGLYPKSAEKRDASLKLTDQPSLKTDNQDAVKTESQKESNLTRVKKKAQTPVPKRNKGRPKGSKNKTLEDDDDDFEARVEVLNYTGQSGRPKRTSLKVKVESEEVSEVVKRIKTESENPENKELPKRKSKKNTAPDVVSLEEMKLSDDEDVLEWKGVGEMKNRGRGRPKGSALKKYEIIIEPIQKEDEEKSLAKEERPESLEDTENTGVRISKRRVSFLCEICAEKFSLKYLLDEHYQKHHPSENITSEFETKSNKSKHPDNDGVDKEERNDSEISKREIKDRNIDEEDVDKDFDSADEEQDDFEDQDWKISDDEADIDDYDDEDDYHVQNSSVKKRKIKVESTTGEHTCPECFKKFKNLVSLQVHKIVHMKKELAFECVTCKQKFLTRSDLQLHTHSAHKVDYGTLMYFGFMIVDGKIQCEICAEDFDSMEAYHDHRPNHLTLKHLCHNCGHGFESSTDLETHTQSNCTENKPHLKCEACHERFVSFEDRKKHIKAKHVKESDFICQMCGLSKDNLKSLKEHITNHTSERIYQCETCNKTFSEKRNLLDHRMIHLKTNDVECPTCFKTLGSQRSLQMHMHRHTMKKKFSCRICGEKFETKDASSEHEKMHEEDQENQQQEHKCGDCGRVFSNRYRLQRHSQVHFEERTFECFFCEEKFKTGSSLLAHKKTKHPDVYKMKKPPKVLICEHCGFKTTHKQRLTRHLQVHNTEKLFECEFCGKKFQTMTSCSSHKMIHRGRVREPGKKFICQWVSCNKEFIKPATLRRHLNSHLFKVVSSREDCDCQECAVRKTGGAIHGSSVDNLEQIGSEVVLGGSAYTETEKHEDGQSNDETKKDDGIEDTSAKPKNDSMDILREAISHIEESENDAEKQVEVNDLDNGTVIEELDVTRKTSETQPVFPCPFCTLTFSSRCKLVEHFSKHHEKHKFPVCDVCNKVYLDKKNLKEHQTVHSGVKSFKCEVCDKVFRTRTSLRQHSHIHSEDKPFVCSYCGHGFTQRGYFLEHVRRHTGERPYSCHVCLKSFVSNDLRKRHMYTHTGDKPHQCSECGKSFIDKSLLVVHLRTHVNYRPFQCGKCDKAFFANAKLQRHLATVHNIDKRTLSDYFPTRINKGLGWRHKNKANKEKIKPDTQYVVYIDQHGNIISRVETRPMEQQPIAPNIKETGTEGSVDGETQTPEEEAFKAELEEEGQLAIKQEQTHVQNIPILNKSEQSFIPLGEAIEVHTRRDASGQLQIYTIPQPEKKMYPEMEADFTAEALAVDSANAQEINEAVEVFQMVSSEANEDSVEGMQIQEPNEAEAPAELIQIDQVEGEVAQEGTQYATIVGDDQSNVQHIELIQAVSEGAVVESQQGAIQILTDLPGEQGNVLGDQNIEIQYAQPEAESNIGSMEQLAQDISINIGEDGTVNIADLEKIEALRNLYTDQQIVIVLENQNQQ